MIVAFCKVDHDMSDNADRMVLLIQCDTENWDGELVKLGWGVSRSPASGHTEKEDSGTDQGDDEDWSLRSPGRTLDETCLVRHNDLLWFPLVLAPLFLIGSSPNKNKGNLDANME